MSCCRNSNTTAIEGIEESLNAQSARHEELIARLDSRTKQSELEQRVHKLEETTTQRDKEIWALRKAVDNAEQYSRWQNIELHGVNQHPNENLLEVINNVATKLEVPQLSTKGIEAAHRLKAKEGGPATILVRFTERRMKDLLARMRATLRRENIYISKNLTPALKNFLWTTKVCVKEKSWKFTWVRNGKIFVKQKENAVMIQIDRERYLTKIN